MSQSTHSTTKRNIFWFRRDLRLADNPALLAAIENSDEVVAVYILDEKINKDSGAKRLAYLGQSLRALDDPTVFLGGLAQPQFHDHPVSRCRAACQRA